MIASFVIFLVLFMGVGILSALKSKGHKKDYYLAGRNVSPWLAGLSAVATNNSGFMFIGVIGFTYSTGLAAIWLMVGWIFGDFLASLFVHKRLREVSGAVDEVTFSGVLSQWRGTEQKVLRGITALITILFLGAYAAAQLKAGGKALHSLLGWDLRSGALIGSIIVAAYCLSGGIRASIWTDAAQSIVMILAMGILMVMAIMHLGGPEMVVHQLGAIPGYLSLTPEGSLFQPKWLSFGLFVIGWLFAGLSVIGQPHIMVRFMALKRPGDMRKTRLYYYGWYTLFYAMATVVGLLARLYLSDTSSFDAELALPLMATEILPPVLVGLVLAGIFAATMSTADSLILSCSAAITHDLFPRRLENIWLIKAATLMVTALALWIALADQQSVFRLVIVAWSVLASAFAPLLIVKSLGREVPERLGVMMMVVGVLVDLMWIEMGWSTYLYEGMAGILSGLLVYAAFRGVFSDPVVEYVEGNR